MNLEFTTNSLLNKYKLNKYLQEIKFKNLIYDLLENVIKLMTEYIEDNVLQIIHYDIYDDVWDHAYNIVYVQYIENK